MDLWNLFAFVFICFCPGIAKRIDVVDGMMGMHGTFTNISNVPDVYPWRPFLITSKVLGEGTFGRAILYKLKAPCTGMVVVKEIKDCWRQDIKYMAENEINVLEDLRGHPNVIHMYDYYPKSPDSWSGRYPLNIMTEVAYGGELDSAFLAQAGGWFGTNGRVWGLLSTTVKDSRREAKKKIVLMVLRDMLNALIFIHSKGYIHQDIKPANLWSASKDLSCVDSLTCRYILGDVGVATKPDQFIDDGHGNSMPFESGEAGSPAYMSPEQSAKLGSIPKSDVYSLGVSIAEIVVKANTATETHEEILSKFRMKDYIPQRLRDLVGQMAAPRWQARPTAAEAFQTVNEIIKESYAEAPDISTIQAHPEPECVTACREAQERDESCKAN